MSDGFKLKIGDGVSINGEEYTVGRVLSDGEHSVHYRLDQKFKPSIDLGIRRKIS